MKTVTTILILLVASWTTQAESVESKAANAVALYATNQIEAGEKTLGNKLLGVAFKLNPNNERALLTKGLLKRGKKLDRVNSMDRYRLSSALYSAGHRLVPYSNNSQAQKLAALYLSTANRLTPDDSKIFLGLAILEARGYETNLEKLLTMEFKLAGRLVPVERPQTFERRAASLVAGYGTMLVRNLDNGMPLVEAALRLDPECKQALLTRELKKRAKKPESVPQVDKTSLVTALIARGKAMAGKKEQRFRRLASLYFAIVLHIDQDNKEAIVAATGLESKGEVIDLKKLIQSSDDFSLPVAVSKTSTRQLAKQKNVAVGCSYKVSISPDGKFPDDGGNQLTNGKAPETTWGQSVGIDVGWGKGQPVKIDLNLKDPKKIDGVRVYVAGNGYGGIHAPAKIVCRVSRDGIRWQDFGSTADIKNESGWVGIAKTRGSSTQRWTYLQVEITPTTTWLGVAEIEALGQ